MNSIDADNNSQCLLYVSQKSALSSRKSVLYGQSGVKNTDINANNVNTPLFAYNKAQQ